MSSSLASSIWRSTAFQLTARYAFLFIVCSLLLFFIAYALLAGAVRAQDQKLITEKLNEYAYIDRTKGFSSLAEFVRRDTEEEDLEYFVRVLDQSGAELLTIAPAGWERVPRQEMDAQAQEGTQWRLVTAAGGGVYEFGARRLHSGAMLIVGADARQREELLRQFQHIFLGITASVVLMGVVAGTVLANRTLAPIRDLIATVRSIQAGSMDARVPTRGTAEDELDELANLFNAMLGRINTLIQGMRDALDNVAHDLRTPLTRAKAVVETALQSNLDARGLREALMDCAEENERIRTTLNTLMDISEAETGTMSLDIRPTDVSRLIRESADVYEYLAQEKGLELVTQAPEGLMAAVDAGRVRQVLANLLDNAIKYSAPGTVVSVHGRMLDGRVTVTVEDQGEGIAEEDMPRIFERLYRGDKSRTRRGLGLGLSLVQAVLKAHGGEIRVDSQVGRGSRFTFTLPALSALA